jgi:hypothetical protein
LVKKQVADFEDAVEKILAFKVPTRKTKAQKSKKQGEEG